MTSFSAKQKSSPRQSGAKTTMALKLPVNPKCSVSAPDRALQMDLIDFLFDLGDIQGAHRPVPPFYSRPFLQPTKSRRPPRRPRRRWPAPEAPPAPEPTRRATTPRWVGYRLCSRLEACLRTSSAPSDLGCSISCIEAWAPMAVRCRFTVFDLWLMCWLVF